MKLKEKLSPFARKIAIRSIVRALSLRILSGALLLTGEGLFDSYWPFESSVRAAVLAVAMIVLLDSLRIGMAYWRTRFTDACLYLDKVGGEGRLLGAYELSCEDSARWGDPEFVRAEIEAVEKKIDQLPRVSLSLGKPLRIILLTLGMALYLLAFDSGALGHQARRVVFPWKDLPPLQKDHIQWVWPPEGFQAQRGSRLKVEVFIKERVSEPKLVLQSSSDRSGKKETVPLIPAQEGRWSCIIGPLQSDLIIRAKDGPFLSETRHLKVRSFEGIRKLTAKLFFPEYTQLPPISFQPVTGKIRVLEGSLLVVSLQAPGAEKGIWKYLVGERTLQRGRMRKKGQTLSFSLKVEKEGFLTLELFTPERVARSYLVECIPDNPPRVSFLFPPPYLIACEESEIPLKISFEDDFGLQSIKVSVGEDAETLPLKGQRNFLLSKTFKAPSKKAEVVISASAMDIKEPEAGISAEEKRTVRIVPEETFKLLRKADAIMLLLLRLKRLSSSLLEVKGEIEKLRRVAVLSDQALSDLKRSVDKAGEIISEIEKDPVFLGEKKFAKAILQRSEGLKRLSTPPAERRREWLSQLDYFVDELLGILERLLGEAKGLQVSQGFFFLLAKVSLLPEKELQVINALEKGAENSKTTNLQRSINETVQRAIEDLLPLSPPNLKDLSQKISHLLSSQALKEGLEISLSGLLVGKRSVALKGAKRSYNYLKKLNELIKIKREIGPLSLWDLISALQSGLRARDELGLEQPERIFLWGPGSAEKQPEREKPEVERGILSFGSPSPPEKLKLKSEFWAQPIKSYRVLVQRILGNEKKSK